MQETVCSRASSVGIPTASDAKKVREINDSLLDIMGRLSCVLLGYCKGDYLEEKARRAGRILIVEE